MRSNVDLPVQAEHADLGAREEAQGDVAKDDPLRGDNLPDAIHRVNELCHGEEFRSGSADSKKVGNYRPCRALDATAAGRVLPVCPTFRGRGDTPLDADAFTVAARAHGGERRAQTLRLLATAILSTLTGRRPYLCELRRGPADNELRTVAPRAVEREELESFHRSEYVDLVIRKSAAVGRGAGRD